MLAELAPAPRSWLLCGQPLLDVERNLRRPDAVEERLDYRVLRVHDDPPVPTVA
jgi:hypothetical protein